MLAQDMDTLMNVSSAAAVGCACYGICPLSKVPAGMRVRIRQHLRTIGYLVCFMVVAILLPVPAFAHCDTLDGPVVQAARKALETGDLKRALIWVKHEHEAEIETAFKKALAVRKLGAEAKELADMFFFETLVRLHRSGEGAAYTGLKPAGAKIDPAIAAVDKAVETGSIASLSIVLADEVRTGLEKRFKELVARKQFAMKDVEAGREYVAAYVELMHFAEGIHSAAAGVASEHQNQPGHEHHEVTH
jgi:hypothetical protein